VNIYYDPEKFGLTTVGEIDWSDGCYQFDLTVVWKRDFDGRFVYAEDSGCSCPSPFEDIGIEDLTVLRKRGGLNDFKKHCAERQAEGYHEDRQAETVELLERMHAAGAR
jgi:hypothetical protein